MEEYNYENNYMDILDKYANDDYYRQEVYGEFVGPEDKDEPVEYTLVNGLGDAIDFVVELDEVTIYTYHERKQTGSHKTSKEKARIFWDTYIVEGFEIVE